MGEVTQAVNFSLCAKSAGAIDWDKDMDRGTGKRGHESGARIDGSEVVSSLKRHSKIRKRSKR